MKSKIEKKQKLDNQTGGHIYSEERCDLAVLNINKNQIYLVGVDPDQLIQKADYSGETKAIRGNNWYKLTLSDETIVRLEEWRQRKIKRKIELSVAEEKKRDQNTKIVEEMIQYYKEYCEVRDSEQDGEIKDLLTEQLERYEMVFKILELDINTYKPSLKE